MTTKQADRQKDPPQEQEQGRRREQGRSTSEYAFSLAVQALGNGVPLKNMPPGMILALSSRIGNSTLASIIGLNHTKIENANGFPTVGNLVAEPFDIGAVSGPVQVSPPGWASMPELRTPPSGAGVLAYGGTAFE